MNVFRKSVGLEVRDIKFRPEGEGAGWFASAHVVVTDLDGRKANGWVHLVMSRRGLKIDHFEVYDDVDPELLRFAVATQGRTIIDAVEARSSELRLAA